MDALSRCQTLRHRLESLRSYDSVPADQRPLVNRLLSELDSTEKDLTRSIPPIDSSAYLPHSHPLRSPVPFQSPRTHIPCDDRDGLSSDTQKLLTDSQILRLQYDLDQANRINHTLNAQIQLQNDEIKRIKSQIQNEIDLHSEIGKLRRENEELVAKNNEKMTEMIKLKDLKEELSATAMRVRSLEREFGGLTPRNTSKSTENSLEIANLRRLLQEKEGEIEDLRGNFLKLREELEMEREDNEEMRKRLINQKEMIENFDGKCEKLETELENSQKKLQNAKNDLEKVTENAKNDRKQLEKSLESFQKTAESEQSQVLKLFQKTTELEAKISILEGEKSVLVSKIDSLQSEFSQKEAELMREIREKEEEIETAVGEIGRLKEEEGTVRRLQEQIRDLEQERDHLQQTYEAVCRSERISQQLMQTLEREGLQTADSQHEDLLQKLEDSEGRVADLEELLRQYQTQFGTKTDLEMDLMAERRKVEILENQLKESVSRPESGGNEDLRAEIEQQREEIVGLELELMQLRDELGRSQHLQFKAESRVRELEREAS